MENVGSEHFSVNHIVFLFMYFYLLFLLHCFYGQLLVEVVSSLGVWSSVLYFWTNKFH